MLDLTAVQELAQPLVSRMGLVEVRLFESHGRHVRFLTEGKSNEWSDLGVNVTTAGDASDGGAVFLMQAELSLEEVAEDRETLETGSADLATFSVTYGALYSVEGSAESVDQAALQAFGHCVASLAMWPYIRAEMARLTEAMHTGSMTLPMLTQQDLVELAQ